ncbi:hypothetical protein H8E77_36790 [bacterium]|nr:hypothetical protein [bacterium]
MSLALAQAQVSTEPPPVEITQGWQYRWGDSPIDEKGIPLWTYDNMESPEWKPTTSTMNPPERKGHKILWLRVKLPQGQWKQPALRIPTVHHSFEVYLGDKLMYRSGDLVPSDKNKFTAFKWYIIPLEVDFHGKTLAFRIYSADSQSIGIEERVNFIPLGSQSELTKNLIKKFIDMVILGCLFIFIGLFSISIFLRRKGQKEYNSLSFGCFSLCIGIGLTVANPAGQLLFDAPIVFYYLFVTSLE